MKKSSIVKATLCGVTALAIVASMNVPKTSSATLNAEKGLAGISITLDKYCAQEAETVNQQTVASQSAINQGAEYANLAISIAQVSVNIREEETTDSKVVGKLYRGAAADVLAIGSTALVTELPPNLNS